MKIKDLYIYPIKSTKGIALNEVNVTEIGFENDRYFGIVNTENEIVTARENARLLKTKTEINSDNLTISYNNDSKTVSINEEVEDIELSLFNKEAAGKIINPDINKWLTQILESDSKLVKINLNQLRKTNDTEIAFSDSYPIHLVNEASVEALNEKLDTPVEIGRFRPNIVVSGFHPFEEENWSHVTIGDCEFRVAIKTERCSLITINPLNGEKDKKQEPLRTLAKELKSDGKVNFGIYLVPTKIGTIRTTDVLKVYKK